MNLNKKIERRMGWALSREDYSPTYQRYDPGWPYEWPKPIEGRPDKCY